MGTLRAVSLALVAACGSSQESSTSPRACEPGRCLEDMPRVIKPHRPEAKACFEDAAKKDPALKGGRLIINLEVDPSGEVVDATQGVQSNQITDPGVVACVIVVMLQIKFPPGKKVLRGFHTFEFTRR